jgi:hypothetical protein
MVVWTLMCEKKSCLEAALGKERLSGNYCVKLWPSGNIYKQAWLFKTQLDSSSSHTVVSRQQPSFTNSVQINANHQHQDKRQKRLTNRDPQPFSAFKWVKIKAPCM